MKKLTQAYRKYFYPISLILASLNYENIYANENEINTLPKDQIIINMSDVPKIPWDIVKVGVHTAETFTSAVHGNITPINDSDENLNNLSHKVLFNNYSCIKNICTATLKKGILFHNNREVNAYDLEFSLVRQLFSKEGSNFAKSILDDITGIDNIDLNKINYIQFDSLLYPSSLLNGIQVVDKYNIKFILKRVNKVFFKRISDGRLPIVPIEELESNYLTWKKYPIGFGPYKVTYADYEKFEFSLQRTSDNENIPKYIKLVYGTENGGDIKLLLSDPNRIPNEFEKVIISENVHSNGGFLYNYQTQLGKNLNFRKAISLALDRNKIAETSRFKEMQAEDQMLPNSSWQKEFRANIEIQKQNILEAKRLLNLVPHHLWKNKIFQVPTYWGDSSDINKLPYVIEIKKQLKEIGIDTQFLNTNNDYDKFKDGDENVIYFTGFAFSYKDPNRNFGHFRKGSYFTYEQ
ncbi:MAG: hypothetical protein K2X69_16355, partial [Silvanigrellaceae bacterium]|nr:hypothetical protein [Silvanigrellaceae bacterium]